MSTSQIRALEEEIGSLQRPESFARTKKESLSYLAELFHLFFRNDGGEPSLFRAFLFSTFPVSPQYRRGREGPPSSFIKEKENVGMDTSSMDDTMEQALKDLFNTNPSGNLFTMVESDPYVKNFFTFMYNLLKKNDTRYVDGWWNRAKNVCLERCSSRHRPEVDPFLMAEGLLQADAKLEKKLNDWWEHPYMMRHKNIVCAWPEGKGSIFTPDENDPKVTHHRYVDDGLEKADRKFRVACGLYKVYTEYLVQANGRKIKYPWCGFLHNSQGLSILIPGYSKLCLSWEDEDAIFFSKEVANCKKTSELRIDE